EGALPVFIHSWNPELGRELDALYSASASSHEELLPIDSLASQHLSLARCLAMRKYASTSAQARVERACGCSRKNCDGPNGKGGLYEAQSLRRLGVRSRLARAEGLYVLDQLFLASSDVARSFAQIGDGRGNYSSSLARQGLFMRWAHIYWAHHITSVLSPAVRVQYLDYLDSRDFTLARFVRFGSDCMVPLTPPLPTNSPDETTLGGRGGQAVAPEPFERLADHCPAELRRSTHALCPWYAPACPFEHAKNVVLEIRRAERVLKDEGLPPGPELYDRSKPRIRRLLSQERFEHIDIMLNASIGSRSRGM
ncbi:MAG: hypothetical protein SGPRY_011680, partial [Prymnesium sp.]